MACCQTDGSSFHWHIAYSGNGSHAADCFGSHPLQESVAISPCTCNNPSSPQACRLIITHIANASCSSIAMQLQFWTVCRCKYVVGFTAFTSPSRAQCARRLPQSQPARVADWRLRPARLRAPAPSHPRREPALCTRGFKVGFCMRSCAPAPSGPRRGLAQPP